MRIPSCFFIHQKVQFARGFLFLTIFNFLISLGICEDGQDFEIFKKIYGLLLNRDKMIQTAVIEHETTITDYRDDSVSVRLEEGVEKYKLNRAYCCRRFFQYKGGGEKPKEPRLVLAYYWNGISMFTWDKSSNNVMITGPNELNIGFPSSCFCSISFILPLFCFQMEYTGSDSLATCNDLEFLQRNQKDFSVRGLIYTENDFKSGFCNLQKIGDHIWRLTVQDLKKKKLFSITEFDERSGGFPVKLEAYNTGIKGVKKEGLLMWRLEATDLREMVPGIYLPYHVKRTFYSEEGEPQKIVRVNEIKIKKIELNIKIDDFEFMPKFPKGTRVIDKQKGTMYTVKEDQK